MKTFMLAKMMLTGAALALVAGQSTATDTISLGTPSYGGSGCPGGSAATSVSPDGKSLSILFDDYMVEAGGANPRVARKSCNLSIPVHVPNGFSISLIDADYRGFVDVPRGGSARLDAEYFFAGQRGPAFRHNFNGGYSNTYTYTHNLAATANVWSRCGQDVNLRANTGMMVRAPRGEGLATVDSADFKAGIVYHIRYRTCR